MVSPSKQTRAAASLQSSSDWTRSFRPTGTWRTGQITIWTLTACALLLPLSFSHTTQADPADTAPSSQPAASTSDVEALSTQPASSSPSTLDLTAIVAGKTVTQSIVPTPGMTVGQALQAMGIALSSLDRVSPDASTPVEANTTMRVTRVAIELQTRRETIPAEVRYQPTTKLKAGTQQTAQYPRSGYHEVVEKVWTKNGKETLRKFVSKQQGRAPQHRIIAVGVNSRMMPSNIAPHKRYSRALTYRGGGPRDRAAQNNGGALFATGPLRVVKTLKVMTTGYNGAEFQGGGPHTATGIRVGYGAIAVDPRVIPLGSQLYVEGYGYGFACDVGGAIKGLHIDLAFNSVRAANIYGRKRGVTVHILGN